MDLDALEREAQGCLEPAVFDYFAGGADDEVTLTENRSAWGRLRVRPRVLRDVSRVDTSTTILGATVRSPIAVAPTAFQRLAHPDGEIATAGAAADAGALMVLSTRATASPADCAAVAPGAPRWYQVYVLRDRGRTEGLVTAAAEAGCRALALTVDTPMLGRRRRDLRHGFTVPSSLGTAALALGPDELPSLIEQDPSLCFDDLAWLTGLTDLPIVVKGVLRADDALRCVDAGAAAVWVSNHGGRQVDACTPTADALSEVAAAVGPSVEVYVDGGVRTAADALRALALGARAVFLGRPVLWGLATGGRDGVRAVLEALQRDLAFDMALLGVPTVAELTPDLVAAPGAHR